MPAGTNVPSGVLVSPGGQQGIPGPSTIGLPFVTKTAAYTLTSSDVGKYFICSGGSWTLTLPSPPIGYFQVRNDMGISGTTGTITLAPVGGTIDGQASIPLLAQQECTLITDGTNWRTFGLKREVILGTQDIISAVAGVTILLPAGYRLFVLDFAAPLVSVDGTVLSILFSSDGGSTYANAYYLQNNYNSTATACASAFSAAAGAGSVGQLGTTAGNSLQVKIYPGSNSQRASWQSQCAYYYTAGNFIQEFLISGFSSPTGLVNAVKFAPSSGTINNMFLTVKGVV